MRPLAWLSGLHGWAGQGEGGPKMDVTCDSGVGPGMTGEYIKGEVSDGHKKYIRYSWLLHYIVYYAKGY